MWVRIIDGCNHHTDAINDMTIGGLSEVINEAQVQPFWRNFCADTTELCLRSLCPVSIDEIQLRTICQYLRGSCARELGSGAHLQWNQNSSSPKLYAMHHQLVRYFLKHPVWRASIFATHRPLLLQIPTSILVLINSVTYFQFQFLLMSAFIAWLE